ncbi:MAG: hypothetical protein RLN89_06930 [Parvibaculum sp.]
MNRLIVGGLVVAVVVVAALAVGKNLSSPSDEKIEALRVDPNCLWPVLRGSMNPDVPPPPASVPVLGCAPAGTLKEDGAWTRLEIAPTEENGFDVLYSGTRVTRLPESGTGTPYLAIDAYENYGGSGMFSSFVLARLSKDGLSLGPLHVHRLGDRCNGGLSRSLVVDAQKADVHIQMTPFDILLLTVADRSVASQWAAAVERFGPVSSEIPSCAACCTAVTSVYSADTSGGFEQIGVQYTPATATQMSDSVVSTCLEAVVEVAAGEDGFLPIKEIGAMDAGIARCMADAQPE